MTKEQRDTLRRFRNVQEYLTTNRVVSTATQLAALSDIVRRLAETGADENEATRQLNAEVRRQRELRRALRVHHMRPISRISRRVLGTPGLDAKFVLPSYRADNEALISAATAMAAAAEQHAAAFVAQGLAQDFVQQFRAATAALASAVGTRVQLKQRRDKARETLVELVKRGRASVEMLDAIVSSRLEPQPELLAAWRTAKRRLDGRSAAVPVQPADTQLKVA